MKKALLLFIISLCFAWRPVFSQTGTIQGQIIDSTLNEGVIGANVAIEGTQTGASTDVDGNFSIFNVEPGTYNIVISYIGYKSKIVQGVIVYAGKITTVNTTLVEEAGQLQDIVIEATRETFSEISVISEIRLAEVVAVGISAEQISRSQDRDASQVVRRIPGVNVSDNNFIRIRGLAERYNNVMLHNAFAPSTETDVKAFAFNIIPSSQIDRLLVYKSPAADLPGDFAGGLVKIFTKSIPSENSLVIDYSTQFRAKATFQDFRNQQRGDSYWTGFNTGAYDLPSNFPADLRDPAIADNPVALQQAGQSLNNNWEVEERTAIPDQRLSLTGSFRFGNGKVKIGNITAINYSNAYTNFEIERNDFDAFVPGSGSQPIYNFADQQYSQNIRLGVLHNWAFKFGQNHIIELKNLFNQQSTGQYVDRVSVLSNAVGEQVFGSYDQVYRGIYSGQLLGKHTLFSENTIVDWVVGYNNAFRDQPDYRRYRADRDANTTTLFIPVGNGNPFFFGRYFAELTENTYTASVNIVQKLNFLSNGNKELTPEFRIGGFFENKDRDFSARQMGFVQSNSSQFDQSLTLLSIEELFLPANINPTTGIRIDEQTNPNDNYKASNRLLAGYAMLKFYITPKVNIIAGVRIEDNVQTITSQERDGTPVNNRFPITTALPSVNLTYNLNDKMLFRAAYGQTLNRPEFRELAPFAFFDFNYNFTFQGNPNLDIAKVQNFDLRYEYYPSPAEIISLAAFYKHFNNPIETTIITGSGSTKSFDFNNADKAFAYGVELEVRKSLYNVFGGKFFENLNVVFNASLLKSEVTLGILGQERGQQASRPLQGQADYIVNTGLFYEDYEKGWQVSVLYNVVGRYILFVGFDQYPDIYVMPRNVIDLTVSKSFGEKFTVKAGIADILNQNNVLLQDGNQDDKFERDSDQIIQKFKPGQLFSIGVSYRIF